MTIRFLPDGRVDRSGWHYRADECPSRDLADALDRATAALRFYADHASYNMDTSGEYKIELDMGNRARAALAEIERKK